MSSPEPARPTIALVERPANRPNLLGRLRTSLQSHGADVTVVPDDRALALDPDRALVLLGSVGWYPGALEALRHAPRARRPFVLTWHYEPLPLPPAAPQRMERMHLRELAKVVLRDDRTTDPWSNSRRLLRAVGDRLVDRVVVTSVGAQEYLASRGVGASVVPLGARPSDGEDLGLERDIDVLLLAHLVVPRRKRIVRHLRRRGVPVVALGDWRNPAYFGSSRSVLLNRTKILLNIPRHPGLLSGMTMILGMSNRALVVADPVYRPDPYLPGVHYVSSEIVDMPDAIGRHLSDEGARAAIVERAHRFVREELTLDRSVARIVGMLGERRPEAVAERG